MFRCLLLLLPYLGLAQNSGIFTLDRSVGLSGNSITSIKEDPLGFVWIATKNGLNRYDGRNVRIYNASNTIFSTSDVSDLHVGFDGFLYISTTDGSLYRYDCIQESFENIGSKLWKGEKGQISKIFESKNGKAFYLATSKGLVEYKDGRFIQLDYISKGKTTAIIINDISEDSSGQIWFASHNDGLFTFRDGQLENVKPPKNGVLPTHVLSLSCHLENGIWLGTLGDGLLYYDFKSSTIHDKNYLINNRANIIRKIFTDQTGTWIATEGDGVYVIDSHLGIKQLSKKSEIALSGESVTDVFKDVYGNFWIGTAWNGVNVIPSLIPQNRPFDQVDIPVLSMYIASDFSMIGTDNDGLWVLNNKQDILKKPISKRAKYIQFIKPSKRNSFWLGTFANGLIEYEDGIGVIRQFEQSKNISFNDVRDVIELANRSLWIATWGGGLNYFDAANDSTLVIFNRDLTRPARISNILDLLLTENETLYAATFGDGLQVVDTDKQSLRRINLSPHKSSVSKYTKLLVLYQDSLANIWIGTWEEGLIKYNVDDKSIECFNGEATLGRRTFVSIEEDNQGNLWFGTKSGILKFDRKSDMFRSFGEYDGEYHIKSSFKDQNGILYFGNTQGIVTVDPLQIKNREDTLALVFTDFKIFGESVKIENGVLSKSIAVSDSILLRHDQNIISISYSALEYPSNDKIRYQIKLNGLEKAWRSVGDQTSATYSNLSAGVYLFQVNALRDGIIVGSASISMFVLKPPWATWWAYMLYFFALVGMVFGIVKGTRKWEKMKTNLKIEKITHEKDLELHQTKQRFFINISHEIRTPVTIILGAIGRILEDGIIHQQLKDSIHTIQKNGNYMLQLVNELLDYRKLESDQIKLSICEVELTEFISEVFISFRTKAEELGISYTLTNQLKGEKIWCDPHQLEKAVFNLLSNSFKFTKKGDKIEINVSDDSQNFFIEIIDSGIGIPADQTEKLFDRFYQINISDYKKEGFGIGLSIVKEVIRLHQGKIDLLSEIGEGSVFKITLPKGVDHFQRQQHVFMTDDEHKVPQEAQSVEEHGHTDNTILVVEDNDDIRSYICNIFEKSYHIIEAKNGAEGVAFAKQEIPDLIISDVLMPIMDGVQLIKELKMENLTHHIPIILLTARTGLIFKKEGFDIGADDYISKPFNEQLLFSRVRGLINSRKKLWEKYRSESFISPGKVDAENPDLIFINSLRNIIQSNIQDNDVNPDFLSKKLGMSHSVIYKKLKQLTGLSIVEFVREFKLNIAAELLTKYKYSVHDACYKSGFSDRRYFSRSFKEKFGKTPSEFLEP